MSENLILLIALVLISLVTGNRVLLAATALVFCLELLSLSPALMILAYRGVFGGLVLLTAGVLSSMVVSRYSLSDMLGSLFSIPGLVGFFGGAIASIMNQRGIDSLAANPRLVGGVLLGSLVSVACLGGAPVGPVMAAGLSSVLLSLLRALSIIQM